MSDQDAFFQKTRSGDLHEPFGFVNVGDMIKGEIVEPPVTVDTKYGTRLVVAIRKDDGEVNSVFVKPNQMGAAVQDAIREAGAARLEVGGRLALKHHATKPSDKGQPAKLFQAQYQPPANAAPADAGVAVSDLL